MTLVEVYEAMRAGIRKELPKGVQLYDLGDPIEGKGVVVGVPRLTPAGQCPDPVLNTATWLVAIVVNANEQAITNLLTLVPIVARVIDNISGCTVVRADPGLFDSGGKALPCYEIEVGVDL